MSDIPKSSPELDRLISNEIDRVFGAPSTPPDVGRLIGEAMDRSVAESDKRALDPTSSDVARARIDRDVT